MRAGARIAPVYLQGVAARAALNRVAISQSFGGPGPRQPTAFDYRPPVEAIDDLDFYCNDAPAEMGQGSTQGRLIERASRDRELVIDDPSYMHRKKPGVYGKSFSAKPWEEWVEDPSYRQGGYMRAIWGERGSQTPSPLVEECDAHQIYATEMARNVGEVLAALSPRMRTVLITQHEARGYSPQMIEVFGAVVRIAHLAPAADVAFLAAERTSLEATVPQWLEWVAGRISADKPKAGDRTLVGAIRKEMTKELKGAYVALEEARVEIRKAVGWRNYPHHDKERRARRMSLVGS